ncbi:MAG: 16S rRNA (cytidine(1402)-2'-O)-methyltransferase [SAR86 cluster bacterium]|uniref:Ribosomal RNA small subunit methyltransferase I n=1 Tax=SAR86 cluster bacterium TaxID=2030880 RepID=A0A2A5B0N4_9GAMM|nr:MAG: 16S rRNA (cytidine(1402)-2'-O)-methyltransferase [SAR86 cluster bacterium]
MNDSGSLYIVATPIGNLDDISLRAIEILKSVQLIAAEDTRHSKKLIQSIQVDTPLISYHDFSSESATRKILDKLQAGLSIALISDAGTPLISDPGYKLVCMARQLSIEVLPVPGPCAVTAALSVAGLATDRFVFEGFLSAKSGARQKRLQALAREMRTIVFYESPHRIEVCVEDMALVFGADRQVFIARELTKKFESHFLGSMADCVLWLKSDSNNQKGEFVVVVSGCNEEEDQLRKQQQALEIVELLRREVSMKQAVAIASKITGARKNKLYEIALNNVNFDDA